MADLALDRPAVGRPVAIGGLIVAAFVSVFGVWAAVAPLSTAAIAPGEVTVESRRKTVQHLEGGIVRDILVRDGDIVAAGQVLVRLDRTQPSAMLALVEGRLRAARTLEARLLAEREGQDRIEFPADILARAAEPDFRAVLDGQRRIFEARREDFANKVAILHQRDSQVRAEIGGLDSQIDAEDRQLRLIAKEVDGITDLVARGIVPRPRLLALQRRAAEIDGERGKNVAAIARARQAIAETELKIQEIRTQRLNEVVTELREVQSQLYDLGERQNATRDVLARTDIRAPIAGTVVGLRIATDGGVVAPGEALLDIVPNADRLLVDARVRPSDIDVVRAGLAAEVRFTAFSQRNLEPADGDVLAVSADRLVDALSPEGYYLARIALRPDALAGLNGATLHPGMQAEVMIVTGTRTALSYFLKPLSDSFGRAFRED